MNIAPYRHPTPRRWPWYAWLVGALLAVGVVGLFVGCGPVPI